MTSRFPLLTVESLATSVDAEAAAVQEGTPPDTAEEPSPIWFRSR